MLAKIRMMLLRAVLFLILTTTYIASENSIGFEKKILGLQKQIDSFLEMRKVELNQIEELRKENAEIKDVLLTLQNEIDCKSDLVNDLVKSHQHDKEDIRALKAEIEVMTYEAIKDRNIIRALEKQVLVHTKNKAVLNEPKISRETESRNDNDRRSDGVTSSTRQSHKHQKVHLQFFYRNYV